MAPVRLLMLTLVLLPASSTADNHRAQDWPEGSAMHTGRLMQERLAAADKKLHSAYRALPAALHAGVTKGERCPRP